MSKISKDDSIFVVIPKKVIGDERLSSEARVIWFYLAGMDFRGNKAPFPSVRTLATRAGCGLTRARECLTELETYGAIKVRRRLGKTSLYEIVLPEKFAPPRYTVDTPPVSGGLPHRQTVTKEHKGKEDKSKDTKDVNVRGLKKLEEMKRKYGF